MFWEGAALDIKHKQKLVILLLDFEKAYDRVDWNFLEGIMLRFGFHTQWITMVSILYSIYFSKLFLVEHVGRRF